MSEGSEINHARVVVVNVADHAAIIERVNQFGLAIDLRNWQKLQSLFNDPVEFDYSSIGETAGTLHPEDIVNTARRDLGGFQATQHLITNHHIELLGDAAKCQAHVRALHFLPNNQGDSIFEMGGYYTVELGRSHSGWQIHRWKFSILWSSGNSELFNLVKQREIP